MSEQFAQVLENPTPIARLDKDAREAARRMSVNEARFLVDTYYAMQRNRIRTDNQVRSLSKADEPTSVIEWFLAQDERVESNIRIMLDLYSDNDRLGQWARSNKGIGPVIAAGLLAYIDLKRATTAGQIWRYAGLDPTASWAARKVVDQWVAENWPDKPDTVVAEAAAKFGRNAESLWSMATENGQSLVTRASLSAALARRPWNANLKTLCWKMGESFVKVSGNPESYYGRAYVERKALEIMQNDAGKYADIAARKLQEFNVGKSTDAYAAYSTGRLPPAHIHARAKRWTVKLFLAHYHEVGRRLMGLPVPAPFAIAQLGHAHYLEPPNMPEFDSMA